jgi:hypothetical protein
MLWMQARLDICVTVVDANGLCYYMGSLGQFADTFDERLDKSTADGIKEGQKALPLWSLNSRRLATLLKTTDLVSQEDQNSTLHRIRKLNLTATVIPT